MTRVCQDIGYLKGHSWHDTFYRQTWVIDLLGAKLSEYHTGHGAFPRDFLKRLSLEVNSDDFVFDNQMLVQNVWLGYKIAEVSCPTKYFPETSSINLIRSLKYGFG